MMGPNFWRGLAERIGGKVKLAGDGLVKTASAALGEITVVPMPNRIPLKEAEAAGFYRLAKPMGWGLYRAEDIDGGLGSIWSIEKAADGSQFLVKQMDPDGEVMRRSAGAESRSHEVSKCPGCGSTKAREDDYGELLCANKDCERRRGHRPSEKKAAADESCSSCKLPKQMYREERPDLRLCGNRQCEMFGNQRSTESEDDFLKRMQPPVQRIAVAPPGEERLVKKLKHDTSVDNPWAVAWSIHNKKASSACGSCGHGHDGDVCDDCGCRIFVKKALIVVTDEDLIKHAAEKCPTCHKPMKENTDGNPKFCQGHD